MPRDRRSSDGDRSPAEMVFMGADGCDGFYGVRQESSSRAFSRPFQRLELEHMHSSLTVKV